MSGRRVIVPPVEVKAPLPFALHLVPPVVVPKSRRSEGQYEVDGSSAVQLHRRGQHIQLIGDLRLNVEGIGGPYERLGQESRPVQRLSGNTKSGKMMEKSRLAAFAASAARAIRRSTRPLRMVPSTVPSTGVSSA